MWFVALRMLVGDTAKYIGIVMGVTFAALIMSQQPSIFVGLMQRTYSFITDTAYPQLWIADPEVRFIDDVKPMQDTQLLRVRGIPGIAWAVPLYKGMLRARTPDGAFQNTMVVGLDDATLIGGPTDMIDGRLEDLRRSDGVIVDLDGAEKYLKQTLPDGTTRPLRVGDTLEINDKRAAVVGIARVSRGFQSNPLIYTTYSRAIGYAPAERLKMTFILAGLVPNHPLADVSARVHAATGLGVYTADQFKDKTYQYFMKNTGIPINFGIAVTLGFVVGAAVAGMMFFNFAHDNAKQFAALKAMGLSNARLVGMLLLQALFTGATGWGIGIGLAAWFGHAMRHSILAFKMTPAVLLLSGSGVLLIMTFAALIAVRKVVRLEPAMVFK